MKMVGVVILYNPTDKVFENILSYYSKLELLWIMDNSEIQNKCLIKKLKALPNIRYIFFGENRGISFALNYAICHSENYKYILTMDQDSSYDDGMIEQYFFLVKKFNKQDSRIAVYGSNYLKLTEGAAGFYYVKSVITSGSIVNIDIAKRIGLFDENLFIDEVDHEFCYRAKKNGFHIVLLPSIKLKHHLGNPITRKILKKTFYSSNHNALRKYYIVRNRIYVMKKYSCVRRRYVINTVRLIVKVLLVERYKKEKLTYILRGIRDGVRNKMGKYE